IKPGATNLVAVRASVTQPSSRWYSGAGIYRHVWMTRANPVRLDRWSTAVTMPMLQDAAAAVTIKSAVVNDSTTSAPLSVDFIVLDQARKEVASSHTQFSARASQSMPLETTVTVWKPHRWSIADPYLYSVEMHLRVGAREVDVQRIPT